MAYSTLGLKLKSQGAGVNEYVLLTVDSLATATGSGYITDAGTASSGAGAPGKGLKVGDIVHLFSGVDSVTAMTSITKYTPCYVSAVSASTGAGTIVVAALS